jgi:hypothetical protein
MFNRLQQALQPVLSNAWNAVFMIRHNLQKFYFIILLPAVTGYVFMSILEQSDMAPDRWPIPPVGSGLLVFSAGFLAIVLPVWFKIIFVRRVKLRKKISIAEFVRYQKIILFYAELSLYIVLVAERFQVPRMPMLLIALCGFYAAYYFFPSKRRLEFEKRLFRVEE